MSLDDRDHRPPYQQVASALRDAIRSGKLAAGDRLPSGAELAEQYGVARMTIQHALRILRDEGLVVSWQGRGVFVRDARDDQGDEPTGDQTAFEQINARLDAMLDQMDQLGQRLARLEAEQSAQGQPSGR